MKGKDGRQGKILPVLEWVAKCSRLRDKWLMILMLDIKLYYDDESIILLMEILDESL